MTQSNIGVEIIFIGINKAGPFVRAPGKTKKNKRQEKADSGHGANSKLSHTKFVNLERQL